MKKRIVSLLLATSMLFATACGRDQSAASANPSAVLPASASAPVADGGRTEPLTLRIGCQGDMGYGDAIGDFFKVFSAHVDEKTGGMIKFETYPNGQLGSEADMMDQIFSDTLDGAFLSINVLATAWQDLYLFSLPFAFDNEDDYWEMFEDPALYSAVENTLESTGLVKFMGPANSYFRGMQNAKRPIASKSDIQGLKLRVMGGEIYSDIYQALGFSTATISLGELYTALEQKVVDGEDMNFTMFYFLKYYETEKYMTELNAMIATNPFIINRTVWDKLSPQEQQIFQDAYKLGEAESKKAFLEYKSKFYNDLKAQGVNIIRHDELSPEAVKEFQESTKGVWEKYESKADKGFRDVFMATREKVFG